MSTTQPQAGVRAKARPVILSLLFAVTGAGIQAIPPDVPLPVDRPAPLQPKTAAAVTCGAHPAFHGHLTSSSSSTVAVSRITNPNVNHYISNIDTDWSCDSLFRYSGTTWNTTASTGTYKWGNLFNSTSPNCYWIVGTDDYTKANSTTDCPDTIAEYAYGFALSPEGVYQQDVSHNGFGDLSFAHSACDIYLGASLTKTGASFVTSNTDNRPGAANCDPMSLDGQNDTQTVTYDSTAPTTAYTTPAGAAGTIVYRNTTASYNVVRTITEAVAGFGGANTWKLQRQIASITAPNTCSTFANDAASGNYNTGTTTGSVSTAQTLVAGKCYRWLANATDQNGNVAAQVTSATVLVDTTVPTLSFSAPITGTTTVINTTSYTVTWSETEAHAGIASTGRSLQRRIATYSGSACGTYANDGSAVTTASPVSVASLVNGKCYQWIQTLTDRAGNVSAATTSGTVRVATANPSANFSTPDEGTTTMQSSTSYTVAWTETAGSGTITARSLQRQKGAIVTSGTCAGVTFANDGSASTSVSPVNVTGLVAGNCHRWVQTLTNSGGNTGTTTSGFVIVDTTAPAGTIAYPEANRSLGGIVSVTGTATDGGSFRDYTLDYGAGTSPSSWTIIGTVTSQVTSTATLVSWDTRPLTGVYTVRLTVRDWAGNTSAVVTKLVYLENSLRGDEDYLTRVPFDLGGGWNLDIGVANGEATLARELFSIPSYGPPQALSLAYSSLESASTGKFGVGWSSNLTQYLTFESGFVVWHRADGGRVPFGLINSTWTPLRGHFETLMSAGSEYTVTLKDQTRLVFEISGAGRLKRIENRFGKALTLVWNTSTATATDASGRVLNLTIDSANNRITGTTDSAGRSWTFGYSPTGNDLTSVTDPAGKVTTLGYDASHRLTTVTRIRTPASGPVETITWLVGYTSGKATSVTDPINTSVSHSLTYNANDTVVGLLKEYGPLVRDTWTYAFDAVGLGRVVSLTDPEGWITTRSHDTDSNLTSITRPVDAGPPADYQTITYAYDTRGNVTSETVELDNAGTVVTNGSWYNATNDMTFRSEADNDAALKLVTRYGYDGSGHLTSVNISCTTSGTAPPADPSTCTGAGTQDAATNLITTYTYTANDLLLDETDPLGRVTHHAYDTWGNETAVTQNYVSGQSATAERNVVTAHAFDQATTAGKAGLVTSMTDPVGHVTSYTYDALGRQLTEALPGDGTIPALTRTMTFDEFGNVLTETESWTGVTRTATHVYDKANRETSLTDAAGVVTTTSYDAAGNALATITGGVTTTRTFDGVGRVAAETVNGDTTTHTYDPAGNERQTVDPAGVTTSLVLDRGGRQTSETVEDGTRQLTTVYVYDRLGHQTSATDPEGAVTTTTYDRPGKTLTTSLAGALSTNAYDRAGNVLSTKNPGGDVSATIVDPLDRTVLSIINCTNSGTTQPAAGVICTGGGTHNETTNVTATTYDDAAGTTLAVKDPTGIVDRSVPNVRNLTWKSIANCTDTGITPPADPPTCTGAGTADTKTNVVSTVSFDGAGATLLTTVSVGLGDQATSDTAYDGAGRAVASRDGLGTVSRAFYDAQGRVTSQVDNCTNTGTTVPTTGWESCAATGTHDATWNVTTSYTYDVAGNRDTETAPNGRATHYAYDGAGRVIEQTQNYTAGTPAPDQNLTTYTEYDQAGRVKAVRAPTTDRDTFGVTAYAYDDASRVLADVRNCTVAGTAPPADPDWRGCGPIWDTGTSSWISMGTSDATTNIITSYTYDGHGNRLSMTAPDPSDLATEVTSVTTRYAYDASDRLCRVLEPASVDLQTLAVPCSTAVSGTTTSNVSTRYTYDAAGRLASMIDARGNTTSYGYDVAGNMTSLTDALTHALSWGYDALGRRTSQSNREGTVVNWTHDGAGRVLSRSGTTYTYDANGNRLTATVSGTTIGTTYDRQYRALSVTVSNDAAAATTYTYSFTAPTRSDPTGSYSFTLDAFGREISMLDPIHSSTPWTSTYRADGQQATLAMPNGNTTTWTYDQAGRPTGSATTAAGPVTRASYVYSLNRAGQRLSEISTITGDPTNGTLSFAYDALGRLTGYSGTPVTSQVFAWDAVPNRTSKQVGGGAAVTTTFDIANRPTSDSGGGSYSSDLDGRLLAPTGVGGEYAWDAIGRLSGIVDGEVIIPIRSYPYDALDRLAKVCCKPGVFPLQDLQRFRYLGDASQIIQSRTWADVVTYNVVTSFTGEPRMQFAPGGSNQKFYGRNGHQDMTWTADSTGAVSGTLRSDPWGVPGTGTGTTMPDFRFQGSWYDAGAGLSWVVSRWYAPALGRFVSEDQLLGQPEAPASRHLYAYGEGEPVATWDPDGHAAEVGSGGSLGFWYRVKAGDTKRSIAWKYLGYESRWPRIFNLNRTRMRSEVIQGQCLWIPKRDATPPNQCNNAIYFPPRCGSSSASMFNCLTGVLDWRDVDDVRTANAAASLGLAWLDLTPARLNRLTRRHAGFRSKDPNPGEWALYHFNATPWDLLGAAYLAKGGSVVRMFANMRIVFGNSWAVGNSRAVTVGHWVFIGSKSDRFQVDILSHEYVHTLEAEGFPSAAITYGVQFLQHGTTEQNLLEATAYLWQGWMKYYGPGSPGSYPKEPPVWCTFKPLHGGWPDGCGK